MHGALDKKRTWMASAASECGNGSVATRTNGTSGAAAITTKPWNFEVKGRGLVSFADSDPQFSKPGGTSKSQIDMLDIRDLVVEPRKSYVLARVG